MSKLIPDAHVHSDDLEWRPWGESLMYRLDPGWSAASIENTVYENLLVLEGELEVDGTTLRKLSYSYRPEGHRTGPVSTGTGATLIAYAGFPGELASSIPVPCVDTNGMEWWKSDQMSTDASLKMLRADEENLDTYYLVLVRPPSESQHVSQHDAPEEAFILEGRGLTYDGHTRGRHVMRTGTYVHRGPGSQHGLQTITDPCLVFKHDYFNNEDLTDLVLRSFPRETDAVRAWRSGRMPDLAKRW
jgi:Domain of unknown function (DUF4437)